MNDDLGDVFRHLADEAPSDEGLLAGVHAASARAAVRRRVLLSSAAALAVLAGGVGVVTARGDADPPPQDGLVVDPSVTPSPVPTVDLTPSPQASASPEPTTAAGSYRGRAVSTDGEPIAGLYVYDIPRLKNYWFRRDPVARTAADGTFDLACPKGAVLLSPYALGRPIPFDAPNWRGTYVGGGYLLGDARRPSCGDDRQSTTIPEGAVIHGALRGPADCLVRTWAVTVVSTAEPAGHIAVEQEWLRVDVAPGAAFRLAGLPPGHYTVQAREEAPEDPIPDRRSSSDQVTVNGPGRYEAMIELGEKADCWLGGPSPAPTPSATTEPTTAPTTTPSP